MLYYNCSKGVAIDRGTIEREANISPMSIKECVLVTLDNIFRPLEEGISRGNGYRERKWQAAF